MADVEQLLRELHHPSGSMSWAASDTLQRLGERRAIGPWLTMLDECLSRPAAVTADDRHYWGAAFGLAAFKEPRAFDLLVRMMRETRGITRQHTASALGRFGDKRAVPALLDALAVAGGNRRLHHAIALSLAELGAPEAIPALLAEFDDADMLNIAYRAAEAVAKLGEPAWAPLLESLNDADAQVRTCAVVGLAALGGEGVVDPLAGMLTDLAQPVRWQVAYALGELGDGRAVPALQAAQVDPDAEVRKVVASALRKLGARQGPYIPPAGPGRHVLTVYVDYGNFLVGDSAFPGHAAPTAFWSKEALERKLAVDPPGLLGVGTSRQYGDVPVVVELVAEPAPLDLDNWDLVIEASLALPSGRLLLDQPLAYQGGETKPSPSGYMSPGVDVPAGTYRVRIHYGGQETLDEDHYHLMLWPEALYSLPRVLKPAPSEQAADAADGPRPDLLALLKAADFAALEAAVRQHTYAPAEFSAALDVAVQIALGMHQPRVVYMLLQGGADLAAWSLAHPDDARRFAQLVQEYNAIFGRLHRH